MNPYLAFVENIQNGIRQAQGLAVSGTHPCVESPSKVLLFSPHPDDECITGLLPLRLMRETGRQIVNIPVTFGSNPERQSGRSDELAAACAYLGWDIQRGRDDLASLTVEDVTRLLTELKPEVVFLPHDDDWNSRHISTHHLVMEALGQLGSDFRCLIVETEFWGAMQAPNLMIEGDAQLVADLVAATSLHVGEVARNPYHLLMPAWMQDSVRRGGELVGGQGGSLPNFDFATLYRLRKWEDGALHDTLATNACIPCNHPSLKALFSWK